MSAMTLNETLPNPSTPLAFLDPKLANEFEVSRYIYTITLGAFMWDLAVNLGSDYYLLFKHRIRLTTVVYYISRISTLAYVITSTVFQIGHVQSCQALQVALGICYLFSTASTSFLFFLRVRAVFIRERLVVAFFLVLWLAILATLFFVPLGIKGAHIGPTKACINTVVKTSAGSSVIVILINDSLVFLAISHRVLSTTAYESGTFLGRMKAFFHSSSLPAVSRALLQGGQQYYLITVGGNLVVLLLVYLKRVPALEHAMFTIPNDALSNAMACIVFRQIKFGLIAADGTSHFDKSITSQRVINDGSFLPRYGGSDQSIANGGSVTAGPHSSKGNHSNATSRLDAEVTKSIERDRPVPLDVLLPAKEFESYEMETRSDN